MRETPSHPTLLAWRAYLAACDTHGTPSEQSQAAFDAWWKLELADSVESCAAEERAARRAESEKNRKKALRIR